VEFGTAMAAVQMADACPERVVPPGSVRINASAPRCEFLDQQAVHSVTARSRRALGDVRSDRHCARGSAGAHRVRIGTGLDAKDVAFSTLFGCVEMTRMEIRALEHEPRATANSGPALLRLAATAAC